MSGQELVEACLRRVSDPAKNVSEPSLRVDIVEICGADERVDRCGAHTSTVGAGEPTTLKTLRIERDPHPVVPETLYELAFASEENEEIARMGIATDAPLDLKRQRVLPRRMSVTPVASQTRAPLGTGIIAPPEPQEPTTMRGALVR